MNIPREIIIKSRCELIFILQNEQPLVTPNGAFQFPKPLAIFYQSNVSLYYFAAWKPRDLKFIYKKKRPKIYNENSIDLSLNLATKSF